VLFWALAWIASRVTPDESPRRWLAVACLLLGCISAGAALPALRVPRSKPRLDARAGELLLLEGCVAEPQRAFEDRDQWTVELAPRAKARVTLYRKEGVPSPSIQYGTRVAIEGRARPPKNFGNEGAFDIETYWGDREIFWSGTARRIDPLLESCGSAWRAGIYSLRGWLLARIDSTFGSEAPQVAALLLAEPSRLDREWTDRFRETGTYHALVVSGTHVTVLAAGLVLLLRSFFVKPLPALFCSASLT
jgi:competence protein ComEC